MQFPMKMGLSFLTFFGHGHHMLEIIVKTQLYQIIDIFGKFGLVMNLVGKKKLLLIVQLLNMIGLNNIMKFGLFMIK